MFQCPRINSFMSKLIDLCLCFTIIFSKLSWTRRAPKSAEASCFKRISSLSNQLQGAHWFLSFDAHPSQLRHRQAGRGCVSAVSCFIWKKQTNSKKYLFLEKISVIWLEIPMWSDEKYFNVCLEISLWYIWREKNLWDLTRRNESLWFDEKNRNKVIIRFRFRYVDDDSIQPRLRPVHWRFLDQDSPAKYGSSIFLSSAMLRNINSNPMPRYKNASEKSHQLNMHDEFRLLKVKRLSLTLSFIPKSILDCEGCSRNPRNCFS